MRQNYNHSRCFLRDGMLKRINFTLNFLYASCPFRGSQYIPVDNPCSPAAIHHTKFYRMAEKKGAARNGRQTLAFYDGQCPHHTTGRIISAVFWPVRDNSCRTSGRCAADEG